MSSRIAGAPISWGVSEVPGWGHQMRRERVLAEMRDLGLVATEAGPDGFLPEEPGELRELLAAYGMTLASGFTPLVLHGEWRAQLEAVARRFRAGGAEVIVLAASTGSDGYDARPELSDSDWARVLRALDEEQIQDRFLDDLYDIYPQVRDHVAETWVQKWEHAGPFAAPGRWRAQALLERGVDDRIFFAGDGVSEFVSMETAARTGLDAARSVRRVLGAAAAPA
jgi:hypothetical protein